MSWCRQQAYDYRFKGDELFETLPDWYWHKVGQRRPIAADLARLLWVRDELARGQFEVVVWVDIDVFVIEPAHLQVAPRSSCIFGYEHWLQPKPDGRGFQVRKNVHNAFCAFTPDCPILAFLIEAILRMVRRVDADFLAPQFAGPKLLTSLHNIVGFELEPGVGAISPTLREALLQNDTRLINQGMPERLLAANLCASLDSPAQEMLQLLDNLAGRARNEQK